MKTITPSHVDAVEQGEKGNPGGIGMAVAFDWGLAVQMLLMPFFALFITNAGPLKQFKGGPLVNVLFFVVSIPLAALLFAFGESVRRGWRKIWLVQAIANAVLFFGGIASVVSLVQGIRHGNYWGIVPSVILLVFSPLIAWRISRPETRRWFERVTSEEARQRHGGLWFWSILLWAIIGGALQTVNIFFG